MVPDPAEVVVAAASNQAGAASGSSADDPIVVPRPSNHGSTDAMRAPHPGLGGSAVLTCFTQARNVPLATCSDADRLAEVSRPAGSGHRSDARPNGVEGRTTVTTPIRFSRRSLLGLTAATAAGAALAG